MDNMTVKELKRKAIFKYIDHKLKSHKWLVLHFTLTPPVLKIIQNGTLRWGVFAIEGANNFMIIEPHYGSKDVITIPLEALDELV